MLVGIRIIEMFCNTYMEASERVIYCRDIEIAKMHFNMMHFIHKEVSKEMVVYRRK